MAGLDVQIDEAEQRLGVRFPTSYREVFRSRAFLTGLDAIELLVPSQTRRIEDDPWFCEGDFSVPVPGAIVIGVDVGGNPLFLKRSRDRPGSLDETVWQWDHDGAEVSRVAHRLLDLFDSPGDPMDRLADEWLRLHGDDPGEDDPDDGA